MKSKGIFKLNERIMHYISEEGKVYCLSMNDTDLVEEIKDDPNVSIIFDIKSGESLPGKVKIIENQDKVKDIFNKMLNEDNTYFKEFDDKLIVFEVTLI